MISLLIRALPSLAVVSLTRSSPARAAAMPWAGGEKLWHFGRQRGGKQSLCSRGHWNSPSKVAILPGPLEVSEGEMEETLRLLMTPFCASKAHLMPSAQGAKETPSSEVNFTGVT